MKAWRWIRGRPWWTWPVVGVLVVVTAALATGDGGDQTSTTGSTSTTTERPTTTTERSTTTTSTTAPSTTTTTAPPPTTTTAPPAPVPGAAAITAGAGGGSGEVVVRWNAVPGATGYRVVRRIAAGGPFVTVADFDITTGTRTAVEGVVNIWSEQHSYVPGQSPFQSPDRSPWFEYVDVGNPGQRCYQVVAYDAPGDAPASNTACGSPR